MASTYFVRETVDHIYAVVADSPEAAAGMALAQRATPTKSIYRDTGWKVRHETQADKNYHPVKYGTEELVQTNFLDLVA